MAYISFKPTDYFNTKLYTGNGSTQTITTGLANDMVWLKGRSFSDNHVLFDSVRGTNKKLHSDTSAAEGTSTAPNLGVTAFNSTGFDLGAWSAVNGNTNTYVSWNWKAGTTSGISGGTITPSSYSINTTSKFGIYKYTGTGANATIAHGLGVKPDLIIIKSLSATQQWNVYHSSVGATKALVLNTTAAEDTSSNFWNNTEPDASVFTIGTNGQLNTSSGTYIAYCFADVNGSSRFSQYTGNGNVDGTFVYTGFKPALVILKSITGSGDGWFMANNKSNPFNRVNKNLFAHSTGAESTNGTAAGDKNLDFLANGFKIRTTNSECNSNGVNYIYTAWAEDPLIGSNGTTGVAR